MTQLVQIRQDTQARALKRSAEHGPINSTQLNSPTTSNRLSFCVWMTTMSLRGPLRSAARPLTLTFSNLFCAGSRSFTCTSLGDPERASATEAAMLFVAGMATSLKLILPQRVGA